MTAKSRVAAYGTAMLDLFVAASARPLALPIPSWKTGVYLRQQIYRCRAAMRKEEHYLLPRAEDVTIPDPDQDANGQWWLRPQPVGMDLRLALTAAGVGSLEEELPPRPEQRATPLEPHPTSADVIAQFLSQNIPRGTDPNGP